jgi:hypothetical protein
MRVLVLIMAFVPVSAFAADPPAIQFFETKIRPVLFEHCYSCHSSTAKSVKGGLKLDSRTAILKGGDSGAVLVPKKPGESLLLKAMKHDDSVEAMPPKGKLPASVIADFERWIADGAAMPESATTNAIDQSGKSHWAFQPIPPRNPKATIDSLIEAKLKAAGLSRSKPANKRTLLRRVYIDLIGLPPTWDELNLFERDPSPDAYERAVDRLLVSPRYGERWGRHWLDVARYADTKDGVLLYGDDRVRPFAYTYRDYVIRAMNEDLPYDRFIREQLAADLVEPKAEPWRLAAMGFLTLGRQFDNNVHDIIDDRIDVVSRGLFGLTVSCARCHDHKYDPIPTADYYSLYGVFSSCDVPLVLPPLDPAAKGPVEFEKKYADAVRDIQTMLDQQYDLLSRIYRNRVGDYLVKAATTKPDPIETAIFFFSYDPNDLRPPLLARWRYFLSKQKATDPIFGAWVELMALPDESFAKDAVTILKRLNPVTVNPLVLQELLRQPIQTKADVAKAYGTALKLAYDRTHVLPSLPNEAPYRELASLFEWPEGPGFFPKVETKKFMSRAETDAFGGKLQNLDKLAVKEPNAPARAMALADSSERKNPRIFIRGNPARPGDTVPRQFVSIVTGPDRKQFANGSGRLDLANAIASTDNPLTARVIVNRVWMHHFGEPLVETPNDFGLRTKPPVQQELLDHLADEFRADGWSLKRLHRRIVLSQTYRQASLDRAECREKDPENKLFWRANRRRLDFEAMRDGMLAASGRLDVTMHGRPTNAANDPTDRRRTVYAMVDRQSLPGAFRAFDFASPDQSAERRPTTTVPQQALYSMNSAFVLEQAKSLANRPEVNLALDPIAKVKAIYRAALLREPTASELKRALAFVETVKDGESKLGPWPQLAQVLLLTNEFLFVD